MLILVWFRVEFVFQYCFVQPSFSCVFVCFSFCLIVVSVGVCLVCFVWLWFVFSELAFRLMFLLSCMFWFMLCLFGLLMFVCGACCV